MKPTEPEIINELVYLCRLQDEEALRLLYERLRPLMIDVYKRHSLSQILTIQDWMSRCWITLTRTLEHYREDGRALFITVFYKSLVNDSKDVFRRARKHRPPEKILSLNGGDDDREQLCLADRIRDPKVRVHEKVMFSALYEEIMELLQEGMSEKELAVIECLKKGCSLKRTSEETGQTLYQIRKTIARARELCRSIDMYEPR